ncbi:type II secretion system F family protein [Leucobacter denitrificans]|uniref:Type II secretion system F family protein n=1 Tax=Leucobacter denitrificans TaxID=683042 RepID=A0A7G9S7D7_9MICO|nr:type II secretion system F family protein [Leucobacter denitrificans]QNN63762.1 type II secretion system F family protein [Leucobacter denitrificans]
MAKTQTDPLFSYRALNTSGRVRRGTVSAPNESAAVQAIEAKGLVPLAVRNNASLGLFNRELDFGVAKPPTTQDLAIASRQLGELIDAGVPLLRALEVAADQTENRVLAESFDAVSREVGQGLSLSAALETRPKVFPELMVNLIRVGEVGGFLAQALRSVTTNFETELRLQQKVKAAMTYPIVVLIVAIIAVVAMMLFVVPIFEELFAGFGTELPFITQVLVSISRAAVFWVPALAVLVFAGWYWYSRHKREDAVRRKIETFKVNMPVFGPLFRKVAIARVSRNLAVMIKAGVPLLEALGFVRRVSSNWVVEEALRDAENSVRYGRSLAGPLAEHEVFPLWSLR